MFNFGYRGLVGIGGYVYEVYLYIIDVVCIFINWYYY